MALIGLWWVQGHVQVPGIRETEAGAIGYDGGVEDEDGGIVGVSTFGGRFGIETLVRRLGLSW